MTFKSIDTTDLEESQLSPDEHPEEFVSSPHKFYWTNRLSCVETLAALCAEQEGGFERAVRSIHLSRYSRNEEKMPLKQLQRLKREVIKRSKDIMKERKSADIGDVVKVPKYVPGHPLLGGQKRQGNALVEAVVLEVRYSSFALHYRVQRLDNGEIQEVNGHDLKRIVRRAITQGGVGEHA